MARDYIGEIQKNNGSSTSQGQSNNPNQGPITNAAQKTGLYDIPFLGGILRDIGDPTTQAADKMSAFDATLPNSQGNLPQSIGNAFSSLGNIVRSTVADPSFDLGAAKTAATLEGAAALPGLVKGAVSAPSALMNLLSPNRAGQAVGATHTAATATGEIGKSAADILTEARQAVEDKFAPRGLATADPALQNAFGKMAQHITGINMEPSTFAKLSDFKTIAGDFSPSDLVKGRQTIVARYGYNPENGNIDQKVANVFRDILTKNAKEITPGLATADQNYQKALALREFLPGLARTLGVPAAAGVGYGLLNILKGGGGDPQSPGGGQP